MTLFKLPGEKKTRARKGQKLVPGQTKPAWSAYQVKNPVKCDVCVTDELDKWSTGQPIGQVLNARLQRRMGGATRLFCYPHGNEQKTLDALEFGGK